MQILLEVIGTKANKSEVRLDLPATIGRSRDASLTVGHPMISRKHCELFDRDGRLFIRDLGSLNGTLVGEQAIGEAALRPGDQFTVGPVTFRVQYVPPGASSSGEAGPIVREAIPLTVSSEALPAIENAEIPLALPVEVSEPLAPNPPSAHAGLILFGDSPPKADSSTPQAKPGCLSDEELNEFLNGFKPF